MDLYRKPLLPEKWSCFPVDKDIDTQQLRKILQKDLDLIRYDNRMKKRKKTMMEWAKGKLFTGEFMT